MAQQTAVDWLMSEMLKPDMYKIWVTLLERAKEMERQQIIDAYDCGVESDHDARVPQTSGRYYNETYKK